MTASIRGVALRPVWALARVALRVEDELRRVAVGLLAQAVEQAVARTLRSELGGARARARAARPRGRAAADRRAAAGRRDRGAGRGAPARRPGAAAHDRARAG